MIADLLIKNARIRTFDERDRIVSAMAVANGRILAVGSDASLAPLAGNATRCLDLNGRTVLPGFIDAHQHLSWFSEASLKLDCSPQAIPSLKDLIAAVAADAETRKTGQWIRAVNYDDTKMPEGRVLTRQELDMAAPDHPTIVVHISGHWAVVNSAALACAGFDHDTPDPPGGSLGRDPRSGRLDGRLFEMAMFNFAFESLAVAPTVVPPFPREIRRRALTRAVGTLNASGICGVGDALCAPSYITSYHDLLQSGDLTVRVNMIVPYIFLAHFEKLGLMGGWGNAWLRGGGIKVIVDGAVAGHTAALSKGYADAPDDHGILLFDDPALLNEVIARIHNCGYQACIHANGDVAIAMALDAIEGAQKANVRTDPRHRIEHCTFVDDALLARMKSLGVMALPFTSYIWQHGEKLRPFYGNRADRMFAHNSFLKSGIPVASGSDHPVGLLSPLLGVQCMVTRTTPDGQIIGGDERLKLSEALRVYTTYAAYAQFEEHRRGRLAPGYLADAVVLAQDPWDVPSGRLGSIQVERTIVDGRLVYGKDKE